MQVMEKLDACLRVTARVLKRFTPQSFRLRGIGENELGPVVEGIPRGLSLEVLESCCRMAFGRGLRKTSYSHLSGWKSEGAYRLCIELDNDAEAFLVFKIARYEYDDVPALRGLPVAPGAPEFIVFNLQNVPLVHFLPKVYWTVELEAEKCFAYICEDLGAEHYRLSRSTCYKRDVLLVAEKLWSLQQAFECSLGENDSARLLCFDRDFSVSLLKYAHESIMKYSEYAQHSVVREVLNQWSKVEAILHRDELLDARPESLIHGDLNPSNIFISKRGNEIRVVDWEWAGRGVPHADLVSLSKGCNRRTRRKALALFTEQIDGGGPMAEHLRWFSLCRLERGLLDAGFLARQAVESERTVSWMPDRIIRALGEVLEGCRGLG
jgi:hypothetical protein